MKHPLPSSFQPKADIQRQLTSPAEVLPILLSQNQLADYIGKSTSWCERARWSGEGPRFFKLGKHIRYRIEDVQAWIDTHYEREASL